MLNRLTYPPAAKTWHIAAWEWIPREGDWLLVSCNFPESNLDIGNTSDWVPPEDGTSGKRELWVIAKQAV